MYYTNHPNVEEKMAVIRQKFPRLRRDRPTAIVHNGSYKTVYGCLCGSKHSCATNYRAAKHLRDWRDLHDSCAGKFTNANLLSKPIRLCRSTWLPNHLFIEIE